MNTGLDFLNWLDHDMCLKIFSCLDDPADLVRVSCVSCSWRSFVIANGVSKCLCLKLFPPTHKVYGVVEVSTCSATPSEVGCSGSVEWGTLEREHRAYAFLARGCVSFPLGGLISDALCASSTDNYPEESVRNTLDQREIVARRASYWSSTGQRDPSVPEILLYKLVSSVSLVTEISIKPFQAYFQWGAPIYSAKAVRFRIGHLKLQPGMSVDGPFHKLGDENFVWSYTSLVYPMSQENRLQKIKLPEPVLCLGGFLKIELLGRVQRQEMDGLFYICVCHVEAMGRPLSPAFEADIVEPSGEFVLKTHSYSQPSLPVDQARPVPSGYFQGNVRHLELIVNMLRGGVDMEGFNWEDEMDEEFVE